MLSLHDVKCKKKQLTVLIDTYEQKMIDLEKTIDKFRHDKLVQFVDKMLDLTPKMQAAKSETDKATLQNAITATDNKIDRLVYDLYGLTEDEIKLVEESSVKNKVSKRGCALEGCSTHRGGAIISPVDFL